MPLFAAKPCDTRNNRDLVQDAARCCCRCCRSCRHEMWFMPQHTAFPCMECPRCPRCKSRERQMVLARGGDRGRGKMQQDAIRCNRAVCVARCPSGCSLLPEWMWMWLAVAALLRAAATFGALARYERGLAPLRAPTARVVLQPVPKRLRKHSCVQHS